MRSMALLVFAAVVVVGGLYASSLWLRRDVREPNLEILPADMVRSPALGTGEHTSAFADGIAQQHPPEGTIPRGLLPLGYEAGEEEARRAGRELVNPFAQDEGALARGRAVYESVCIACHGLKGAGDAPITKRRYPPPAALARPETVALADGELFHVITFGRNNMPPMGSLVDRADRWKVIRYVRKLQETP